MVTAIMAAGKGTRMKSDLPKVIHKLNGRPMVHYVIELAQRLQSQKTILIIGHKSDMVEEVCQGMNVEFALQKEQLGTGHAVQMTEPLLRDFDGDVLVLSGDVPLLTVETLMDLVKGHHKHSAVATLLTSELDNPTGYGRVVRNREGFVQKIVEHKDSSPDELKINEINVGIYIFDAKNLFRALKLVDNNNAQGEYYLPDVISIFINDGKKVNAVKTKNFDETRGINNIEQLKKAETILKSRS
ncbi:MAG: NTP transferase domain-containing protein [Caldithrix sp.]|nr:NTP transferase domain-containing protein [Caldithrix sp.]